MQRSQPAARLATNFVAALVLSFTFMASLSSNAAAGKRLALVIGNSAYQNTSPLRNPANDAELISSKLREIGFDVLTNKNVTLLAAQKLVSQFAKKIKEVGEDGIVMFYYAGHGIQYNGENFIVPVDADLQTDTDIILQGINTSLILKIIELSGAKTNIVVLDACRNNPFAAVSRSVSKGLARMESPSGSFIAYSTAPGQVALDGDGKNSPYTTALAEFITDPKLTLEAVFKKVRRKVYYQTEKAQTTWESTSLIDEVYLVDRGDESSLQDKPEKLAPSVVAEEKFWNQIRDKGDIGLFKTYLQLYPQGTHREIALAQLPRPKDPTKIKPKTQQGFDYTDNDLEQQFAKFNAVLGLLKDKNILRAILSYDRYTSWCCKNLKRGPTGKERYISYGLYGLYYLNWQQYIRVAKLDAQTVKLMEDNNSKPKFWIDKFKDLPLRQPPLPKIDNAAAALINEFLTLHPIVQKANQYYQNELYEFDNAKGARQLHAKLYPQFVKFYAAYVKLADIMLDQMELVKAQEIDYIALKTGKSWDWYGAKEEYYLTRFMLEFQRDPKLNKSALKKAMKEYLANFLEITDFASNGPSAPVKYADLANKASSRLKQMKSIVKHRGPRKWSLDLDVGN